MTFHRLTLLVLLCFPAAGLTAQSTAPATPSAGSPIGRLKLVTWNIQGGYDAKGQEAFDSQVALLADTNADVIGLQEVSGDSQASLYKSKLEAVTGITWNAVWSPIPYPASPGGNLVLSRLPIVASSTRQLDAAANDPTWAGAKRSAARVELAVNGKRINVFFTHLDTDATVRRTQLTMLLDWVKTFSAPRFVGGDFNMMPSEGDYATMSGSFDDAWATLVERSPASGANPGYTKKVRTVAPWTGQPGRIDYWFHEKGSAIAIPTEIAVLETPRSDHYGVVMWVRVQ
jgi:endonuclease/exonuclease/phosphatase family metal-dependent hydrolase